MAFKNKEDELRWRREYRKRKPEIYRKSRKIWRDSNKPKIKLITQNSQRTFKMRLALLRKEKGGKCSICGYNEEINILQFHHLGNKKFNLSAQYKPMEKMREEAKKCILLCPNCHFLLHFKEKSKYYEKE